jgi:hypothetical protein
MMSDEKTNENLKLVEVKKYVRPLEIPKKLNFNNIFKIKVPKEDIYKNWKLSKLLAHVEPEIVEEINAYWYHRNNIDAENGYEYEFTVLNLHPGRLREILQWYLRGMSISLATYKVRIHLIVYFCRRGINVFNPIEYLRINQVVQGFKVGYRVITIDRDDTLEHPIDWHGFVVNLSEDFCSVKFDLDSKDENGNDRIRDVPYHHLSIVRPDPPKLKQKKASNAESKLSHKSKKSEQSSINVAPEQNILKPVEDIKVKHDFTELIAKLKLVKNKTLEESQNKPLSGADDKPRYTASELAQKLNVSTAKIYTMRTKGELESLGYRVESNGRFLSFVTIE